MLKNWMINSYINRVAICIIAPFALRAADIASSSDAFGRALIPDMVADPSIAEIDGTFYLYATTDGWGEGLKTAGTPVVWKSEDFLNWSFEGSIFPSDFDAKYWAPSSLVQHEGRYFLFPTLDEKITAVVADSPEGPFRGLDGRNITRSGGWNPYAIEQKHSIDAHIFEDDDGETYMVWALRRVVKLKEDMSGPDGRHVTFETKREGYSEGPYLFKRKGIYYYLYTLGGHENYQYAYMMSRKSPFGPWESPEKDIIATTAHKEGVFGPGHGCFFNPRGSDTWYFVYLEFGRESTNRQIFADRMEFNPDGTIRPVKLTKQGVGALRPVPERYRAPNIALGKKAAASSVAPEWHIPHRTDNSFKRTESFNPVNALDASNGSRWSAARGDTSPWWQIDLESVCEIKRTEAFFVKPAAGHAYRLEHSVDGTNWNYYGGHKQTILRSPHVDEKRVKTRYLRLTILAGEPGLWEFRVY